MTTSSNHAFDTDLMHERICERDGCNTRYFCTCGKMKWHNISTDLNLCGMHRRRAHDPANDPDDSADQRAYDSFNRFGR